MFSIEVFRDEYPQLRRLAAVASPPWVDPDDVVQEAVTRALARSRRHPIDNLGAYLRTTVVHLAIDERRRRARLPNLLNRLRPGTETASSYPSDLSELLSLGPEDRLALFLVDVECWPADLAGELLGCSANAVRIRVSRARAKLRADLTSQEA